MDVLTGSELWLRPGGDWSGAGAGGPDADADGEAGAAGLAAAGSTAPTDHVTEPELASIPERDRNALLRLVDWRFLAAVPRPGRALCLGDDHTAAALRLLGAEVVTTLPSSTAPTFDLAVLRDPKTGMLEAAAAGVDRSGACWIVWPNSLGRRPGRLAEAVERAGLHVTGVWHPYPAAETVTHWLPDSSPAAWRRFLRPDVAELPAGRVPGAVLRFARRAAWAVRALLGLTPHIGVVARRASAAELPRVASDVRTWLLEAPGAHSMNKLVAFPAGPGRQRIAIKLTRRPVSAPFLRHEAAVLTALDELLETRPPGIPRVRFVESFGGEIAVGETLVRGRPLALQLTRRVFPQASLEAADWLASLVHTRHTHTRESWARKVEPLLDRLGLEGSSAADPDLRAVAIAAIRDPGTDVPIAVEHRDFAPWNVMVQSDRGQRGHGSMGALDWESAVLEGLPLLDLLYFLAYAAFQVDRADDDGSYEASYRALLDPSSPTGRVAAAAVARYCDRVGLSERAVTALRLVLWLVHRPAEVARLGAGAGGHPGAPPGSLFLRLWKLEAIRAARP